MPAAWMADTCFARAACRSMLAALAWLASFVKKKVGTQVSGLSFDDLALSSILVAPLENNPEEADNSAGHCAEGPQGGAQSAGGRRATLRLAELQQLLREPAPLAPQPQGELPRLSPQQIRSTIEGWVPEAGTWIAPRSNGTKALDFLVKSYSHGFPALPASLSRHCSEGVRLIVGALADPEQAGIKPTRAKAIARTLAEAYTGCQAVQARTVDTLQGEVRGLTARSLPAQLRMLVEEYRERALDRTVCHFHPNAPTAGDGTPQQQLPHLANRYRRHLGSSIGTSRPRLEAAAADRNAAGPLPTPRAEAEARFWQEFDLSELCFAVAADVNQAREEAERLVDRKLLLDWAGSHPEIGHRVFYDEAAPELYGDAQPSPEHVALRQPFIYPELACDILLSALAA